MPPFAASNAAVAHGPCRRPSNPKPAESVTFAAPTLTVYPHRVPSPCTLTVYPPPDGQDHVVTWAAALYKDPDARKFFDGIGERGGGGDDEMMRGSQ